MYFPHSAAPARLDRSGCPERPPRLVANSDKQRAPITFGWLAYTPSDRVSKFFHLITLYRLDRVGDAVHGRHIPSQYYGMSGEALREHVRVRQAALLPKLPSGYSWIGPQLIEDVSPAEASEARRSAAEVRAWPSPKLDYARELAASILREREAA